MQESTQKRNQYLAASLGVIALADLIFVWMCLEFATYPSQTVWVLTAAAIYLPVVCMVSVFRTLVADISSAPSETLNFVTSLSLTLARFSTASSALFHWLVPSTGSSLEGAYAPHNLAHFSKWHPSKNPQLK